MIHVLSEIGFDCGEGIGESRKHIIRRDASWRRQLA
jgi:hypothetical protein